MGKVIRNLLLVLLPFLFGYLVVNVETFKKAFESFEVLFVLVFILYIGVVGLVFGKNGGTGLYMAGGSVPILFLLLNLLAALDVGLPLYEAVSGYINFYFVNIALLSDFIRALLPPLQLPAYVTAGLLDSLLTLLIFTVTFLYSSSRVPKRQSPRRVYVGR